MANHGRKFARALALAALCLLLGGCAMNVSTDKLYALPSLPAEYASLEAEINALLSDGAEHAAPISGSNLQSVQMVDLDGDGVEEAVAWISVATTTGSLALIPAASNGDASRYGVLLVYKKKAVGAYLLEKPSGTVLGLQDAQNELAKQTSGEDYSGDWGERHDEQLTDSTAQQTSGEPEAEPEAAPQAAPYTELPLDAEGYPVE